MSKKALDALAEYEESNLFLRGLIPTMGFPSDVVYFDVKEREAGHSKYTLVKMFTLAVDGITSMSIRPIRIITFVGLVTVFIAFILAVSTVISWAGGNTVQGYSTILLVELILGGVIILSLGVVGEYVGKTFMETKKRPRYVIDSLQIRNCSPDETVDKDNTDIADKYR